MVCRFLNFKKAEYIFYFFIFIYGSIIFLDANFGVIDDHGLLDTLFVGNQMPYFVIKEIGRFFPLNGYEYNIISHLSISAYSFYLYNVFQFFVFVFLLYKILVEVVSGKKSIVFLFLSLLILSPGFSTAWLRLFVPERSEIFFFTVFLYSFVKYQKYFKIIYLIIGLISANIALYYKEPAFLMLGSFAFFHLALGWKTINLKQKIFDFLLIVSALIFITIYFVVVYLNKGDILYGATTVYPLLSFIKNLFNYTLSDPILIFILLPLFIWRIYIIIESKSVDCLFDAMLFSSTLYILVFLTLNIFAPYYLLPAYAFGLITILHFITQAELHKKIVFKFLGIVTGLFIVFGSFPAGLYFIAHYKNVPNNFQNTLLFLTEYIKEKAIGDKRVSIFLDGVNRNGGEVHCSFIKYLEFKGLTSSQFDIKSDENDNGFLFVSQLNTDALYTILSQTTASKIHSGDLVIITPYTAKYIGINKKEILKMNDKFELLYHANSFLEIPNIGIKSLMKEIYRTNSKHDVKNNIMTSENIFQMPLDFYVFRKK